MATTSPTIGSVMARSLKSPQRERVSAHQRQNRNAERNEHNVEHDRLLVGALLTADPRKLSIWNRASPNKDFIMKRVARTSFVGSVGPRQSQGERGEAFNQACKAKIS